MTPIQKSDTIQRCANLAQREFEKKMLVITPKDSRLHRFDEVATFIWQLLEQPMTAETIISQVAENFEGTGGQEFEKEILSFLQGLAKKGLIS